MLPSTKSEVAGVDTALTDRNRLEQELQQRVLESAEAGERMRSVVNYFGDWIITFDQHGTITAFNSDAGNIFCYPAPEVIRQNIQLLMPDSYHTQHDDLIANYLRTEQANIIGIRWEVVGRRKDGSTFPVWLDLSEFFLNEEQHLLRWCGI